MANETNKFLGEAGTVQLVQSIKENFAPISHVHSYNDLEDKTHYSYVEVVSMFSVSHTISDGGVNGDTVEGVILEEGKTYTIELDGVKTDYVASINSLGYVYIGYDGIKLDGSVENESDQVSVAYEPENNGLEWYLVGNGNERTLTVYEKVETIKTLDEIYIPGTIARTVYVDEALSNKADTDHNHDDVYYTESEIDTKLAEAQAYAEEVASGKADADHTHNDLYYTESEIDEKIATIDDALTTHTHSYNDLTDRTHYIENGANFEYSSTVTNSIPIQTIFTDNVFVIELGKTYTVNCCGTMSEWTVTEDGFIGTHELTGVDKQWAFTYNASENTNMLVYYNTRGEFTFSISGEEIVIQLDEIYIPPTIARTDYVDEIFSNIEEVTSEEIRNLFAQ